MLVITFLGTIAGIIGIPLAIYFYFASQHDPRLTYSVNPIRVPVVQGEKLTSLKVLFNGADVQGDIIAAQIAVWNAGAGSIRSTDIMAPIQIQTEGNSPILEATIRKMTRPVVGVSVGQAQLSAGRVLLDWKILEKNDGFVLQVIYSGSINTKLSLTGDVAGQKSFVGYLESAPSAAEQYVATKGRLGSTAWLGILVGVFSFFFAFVMRSVDKRRERMWKMTTTLDEVDQKALPQAHDARKNENGESRVFKVIKLLPFAMAVLGLSSIGLGIAALYSLSAPLPPFEF